MLHKTHLQTSESRGSRQIDFSYPPDAKRKAEAAAAADLHAAGRLAAAPKRRFSSHFQNSRVTFTSLVA